jgi:HEAT repeat protein
MNSEPTTAEKISKLPWSIAGNAANTVFLQFTFFGSVFVLFLSKLNLDKTQIGFLLSLLPFSGLIALFITPFIARFGYKRIYLIFFGGRNFFAAFLLLTPWMMSHFGAQATLTFIGWVVAVFAVCRAVGVTAAFPWAQEYVPNSVRGKYSASNNLFAAISGFASVTIAGLVIDYAAGLSGFMILIGLGVLFGLISVWLFAYVPGGAPVKDYQAKGAAIRELFQTTQDKDFLFYIVGFGLVTLGITPLTSFLPLFMEEQVGISAGNVVLLQTGSLLGGLFSTYLWGWTADRYGSRPVTLSGILLRVLLPLLWMVMPRHSPISLYIALSIALLQGIADMGWAIGSARLLYVSIVPPEKRTEYLAVYYAWTGIIGGISQLVAGQIVAYSAGVSGQFLLFSLDPYTGLFALGFVLPLMGSLLLRIVRSDTAMTVEEFAGMFLRGNPFSVLSSLVSYHLAKDERAVVGVAERLGGTRSPLTVDELLELLADPRFNVRFEAVISIARTRRDPRLTEALIQILGGTELALSTVAAWALGRVGDETAIPALHEGLNSPYHSIQAHSARALGALGDRSVIPLLLERLENETDKGLQMAYASALGKLQAREAAKPLLKLLRDFENEGARLELALSLARLVGNEGRFIQLVRQSRAEVGVTTLQIITALKKKVRREFPDKPDLVKLASRCGDSLSRNELERGAELVKALIALLPLDRFEATAALILKECARNLAAFKGARLEYLLLALYILEAGWPSSESRLRLPSTQESIKSILHR